jgi:hypothetical protein
MADDYAEQNVLRRVANKHRYAARVNESRGSTRLGCGDCQVLCVV